jgi:nascent polypeptide-associated complex subunit alpha
MSTMIPGMNPRDMQKAMKRLGIKQEEIEASEVIIKTADKNLVIRNPSVTKVNMGGQETLQIGGTIEEESVISEDDVNTVAEQTEVSKEEARNALEAADGDLAAAIMELQK